MSSSISFGALVCILPVMFWIFNKADRKEVEKVEEKVEDVRDINMEQTYQIRENTYIQQSVIKAVEKLNSKIDKLEE